MDLTTFTMHMQIENLACKNKWTNWRQKTCEINIWWRWWFNSRWSRRRTWDSNQTQNSIRFRFDFSIKLTDSLDSDLSPDSDWDNNYCSVNFWQSWASLQNDHHFHLKRQHFSLRTILNENSCHFVNLLSFAKTSDNSDHFLSLTQDSSLNQVRQSIL